MKRTIARFIIVMVIIGLIGCQSSSKDSPAGDISTGDTPVLTGISISEASNSQVSLTKTLNTSPAFGVKNIRSAVTSTETTADYFAGLGESMSLMIVITNPSGYSISRFKINGTSFTSGSFTTDPIQPGQTTTVIRTGTIFLGNTVQDITYTISDIKYIAEVGQTSGNEKDVVINANSVSSTKVSIGFPGSGTIDDPYLISNKGQLKAVARCTNGNIGSVDGYSGKYLKLTTDLDLTGENWVPIGKNNYDGIFDYSFKGTFDGGGKSISNLTINSSLLRDIGLFGYVYGGTINNTVLKNCQITNTIFNGMAGGIAGSLDHGLVSNCSTSGSVSVTSSISRAAGIVGVASPNSTIYGCSNSATISSGSSSAVHHMSAGGIAGEIRLGSSIQNSYNTGSVSAQGSTYNAVGGIVALSSYLGNSISNCYNIGMISVSNSVSNAGSDICTAGAGIVGGTDGASITNSVWLDGSAGAIACMGTGTLATSKSAADMMSEATYTSIGWDFNTVWKISAGEYPKLIWQN